MNKLIKIKKTQLDKLARRFRLRLVYVFGSVARGDTRADSDLDIAYQSAAPLTPVEHGELSLALGEVFADVRRPIDLIDLNSSSPLVLHMVAREGKLIYGSTFNDALFYCHAMERYLDASPLFELSRQYVRSRLAI